MRSFPSNRITNQITNRITNRLKNLNLYSSGSTNLHLYRKLATDAKKPVKDKNLYQLLYPFVKFARPEFKIVGYSLGLLLISSSVTMFVPFSMGTIIDMVMQNENENDKDESPEKDSGYPLKSNFFLRNIFTSLGSLSSVFGALGAIFVGLCVLSSRTLIL